MSNKDLLTGALVGLVALSLVWGPEAPLWQLLQLFL